VSVDGLPTVDSIDTDLASLAKPYRDLLDEVERDLATVQSVANLLRENRNKLRTALRAIDPTFEPDHGHKPGVPKKNGKGTAAVAGKRTTEQALDLLATLKASGALNGERFTASDLARRDDWPWSQSYSSAILNELHQRGVVRLDQVGGPTGNAKLYVLV